jgi:hypothetical protein
MCARQVMARRHGIVQCALTQPSGHADIVHGQESPVCLFVLEPPAIEITLSLPRQFLARQRRCTHVHWDVIQVSTRLENVHAPSGACMPRDRAI